MVMRKKNNKTVWESTDIPLLIQKLSAIRDSMISAPDFAQKYLELVHSDFYDSAVNLLHYLALRRHDMRALQCQLSELGLSSLGRAEP